MTKDEVLKQALEALEAINKLDLGLDVYATRELTTLDAFVKSTIASIKEALAQPEQVTSGWSLRYVYFDENGIPLMHREPEERNFCPRCGKRTADPTTIHTCTPPQENT